MYLMYVDESGDCGLINSPTRFFVLSGLVVHELRWSDTLDRLTAFRRRMRMKFGLKLREELHASELISRPGSLQRIPKHDRLSILRHLSTDLATFPDINLINVVIDKEGKAADFDVFGTAWKYLIQRFENTLSYRNFPGPANPDDRGMIFPDMTDNKKLTSLIRTMRAYNPIPNAGGSGYRQLTLKSVIEDPSFRDSAHSLFIQATDTVGYLLHQHLKPNSYMRKKGGQNYFLNLKPVLCTVASTRDPLGLVRV